MQKPLTVWGLTGGLVADTPATQIPDNAASACQNIVFSNQGRVVPRPGFSSVYAALPAGQSAYHIARLKTLDGVETIIAAGLNLTTNAVTIYKWTGSAWSSIQGAVSLTGSETTIPYSCQFKGKWYFACGGTSQLVSWDGVASAITAVNTTQSTTALKAPTNANIVAVAPSGSHLFLMNYTDNSGAAAPYGISWGGFLTDNVWNGGNSGLGSGNQLLCDDNEPITAATFFGQFMMVFKARSMYLGVFQNYPIFWEFIRQQEDRGCIAPASIVAYNNMRFWIGDDNVYMFDGQTTRPIGNKVVSRIISTTNPTLMGQAFGFVDHYQQLIHWFMPVSGQSNPANMAKIFTFDLTHGGWTEGLINTAGLLPVFPFQYRPSPWADSLVVGARSGSLFQYTFNATTDNGQAIPQPFLQGKTYDAVELSGHANEQMVIHKIAVHAQSGRCRLLVNSGDKYSALTQKDFGLVDLTPGPRPFTVERVNARFAQIVLDWDYNSVAQIEGVTLHVGPSGGTTR